MEKIVPVQSHTRRAYVRRVPILEITCGVCGGTFEGPSNRRYCDATCRRRAYYGQHAEDLKARRRERYQRQRQQEQHRG